MASVLIVDDDVRIQTLLLRWLRPVGHALRFAENSNAALVSISEHQPSVIVCDVHMPGANGLWLADRVRALAPTTAIILATGDGNVPPFESMRKGVVAYVLKPFDRQMLVNAVAEGVEWSRRAVEQQGRRLISGETRRLPVPQQ